MPSAIDYNPILSKLLQKSEEGRIDWKWDGDLRPSERFLYEVGNGLTFIVWKDSNVYGLRMEDELGRTVFHVKAEEEVLFESAEAERLFNTLRKIYEAARRKGLGVDEKLETVSSLLDKI